MSLTVGPNLQLLVNGNNGEGHYTELMKQFRWLDFHGQPWVINMTTATPPVSPADGDAYVVATGGTGAWAGKDGQIARYSTILAAWEFGVPRNGWSVRDRGTSMAYYWNGTSWVNILAPVTGALIYQGTKNMATDPSLPAPAAGNNGYYYVVSVASPGAVSYANLPASTAYVPGDMIISHGSGTYDVVGGGSEDVNPTGNSVVKRTTDGGVLARFLDISPLTTVGIICGDAPGAGYAAVFYATQSGNYGVGIGVNTATDAGGLYINKTEYGTGLGARISVSSNTGTQTGTALQIDKQGAGAVTGMALGVVSGATLNAAFDFTGRLGLGAAPSWPLDLTIPPVMAGGIGYGARFAQAITATADGDELTALYLNPTFSIASHSGVTRFIQKWASAGSLEASIDNKGNAMFAGSVGVGATAAWPLDVTVGATAAAGVAYGARLQQTLTAAANSDVLTGLYINQTFDDATHTGVTHYLQRWAAGGVVKATLDDAGVLTLATPLAIAQGGTGSVSGYASSGTYAARPAANTVPSGFIYTVVDATNHYLEGMRFVSNGTSWKQVGSCFIFVGTATQTIANTTTPTTMFSTGVGSLSIPGGAMNAAGAMLRVHIRSKLSDDNDQPHTAAILFGGATLITSKTFTLGGGFTNMIMDFDAEYVCRATGASGTIAASAVGRYHGSAFNQAAENAVAFIPATATNDFTAAAAVDLTWAWGAASTGNTIAFMIASVEAVGFV